MSENSKALQLQNVKGNKEEEEREVDYTEEEAKKVTRELQINNGGGKMGMDKQVILKRIRQRKRMNKFTSALRSLVSSPFSKATPPTTTTHSSFHDTFTFY